MISHCFLFPVLLINNFILRSLDLPVDDRIQLEIECSYHTVRGSLIVDSSVPLFAYLWSAAFYCIAPNGTKVWECDGCAKASLQWSSLAIIA